MYAKILILLNLIGFAFVASQPLFYLLALANAQKSLRAPSYIELRQLLDKNLQISLRLAYYITIITTVLLTIMAFSSSLSLLFITSAIALAALMIDVYLSLKGDVPINKIINQWNTDNYPRHWQLLRRKWFYFFHIRQIAGIIGFGSLLVGAVFS
jgi:hypothetical protein